MATLEERLSKAKQSVTLEERLANAQTSEPGIAAGNFFSKGAVDNILALPKLPGALLEGLNEFSNLTMPGRELPDELRDTLKGPAEFLSAVPVLTANDLIAGGRSIPSMFQPTANPNLVGEQFDTELERLNKEDEALRAEHPFASGVGDVGGDVLSLLLGRAGVSKSIRNFEQKLAGKTDELAFGGAVPKVRDLTPGARQFAENAIQSPAMRSLARGTGRSVEAGFEAAALAVVKDGDPFETAGLVMGGQAAGSAVLAVGKGAIKHPGVALSALAFASIIQVGKSVLPGGENSFMESVQTGFDKVAFGLGLGLISAASGAGRIRGKGNLPTNFPRTADALAGIPRAAVISLVEEWVHADPAERKKIEAGVEQRLLELQNAQ